MTRNIYVDSFKNRGCSAGKHGDLCAVGLTFRSREWVGASSTVVSGCGEGRAEGAKKIGHLFSNF